MRGNRATGQQDSTQLELSEGREEPPSSPMACTDTFLD